MFFHLLLQAVAGTVQLYFYGVGVEADEHEGGGGREPLGRAGRPVPGDDGGKAIALECITRN